MKVTMTKTAKGSPDGITVNTYNEGESHVLNDKLANAFVGCGAAVEFKAVEKAPLNKAIEKAPKNKRKKSKK